MVSLKFASICEDNEGQTMSAPRACVGGRCAQPHQFPAPQLRRHPPTHFAIHVVLELIDRLANRRVDLACARAYAWLRHLSTGWPLGHQHMPAHSCPPVPTDTSILTGEIVLDLLHALQRSGRAHCLKQLNWHARCITTVATAPSTSRLLYHPQGFRTISSL